MHVIVVKNRQAAEFCLSEIVTQYGDVWIYALDGSTPNEDQLRAEIHKYLTTDPNARFVVFNYDCISKLNPSSSNYLVLDELVTGLHSIKEASLILAKVIESFFLQEKKLARANCFSEAYALWKEFPLDLRHRCKMDLLGIRYWLRDGLWLAIMPWALIRHKSLNAGSDLNDHGVGLGFWKEGKLSSLMIADSWREISLGQFVSVDPVDFKENRLDDALRDQAWHEVLNALGVNP